MSRKRAGLGRGLDALLEAKETPGQTVAVSELTPNRFQPRARFDDEGMEELTESIRQQGIVQPIVVTANPAGGYTIVAGERRWRAARRAGLHEVPVVIRELQDDRQLLEMALVENLQRSDLNSIEEAEAFLALKETFGMSHEEIGVRVGKSRAAISNSLRLLSLPDEVQELVRDGQLSAGQARPLLTLEDPDRQIELAQRAVKGGLSAREIEVLTRGSRPRRRRSTSPPDPDTAAAADRLTRWLQTRVEIHRRGSGGTIRVHFHSEDELIRLYDVLLGAGGRA